MDFKTYGAKQPSPLLMKKFLSTLISGDQDKVNNDGIQAENIHNLLIESGLKSEIRKYLKGCDMSHFKKRKGKSF